MDGKFRKGDLVLCTNCQGMDTLTVDKGYMVVDIDEVHTPYPRIKVAKDDRGIPQWYYSHRFVVLATLHEEVLDGGWNIP